MAFEIGDIVICCSREEAKVIWDGYFFSENHLSIWPVGLLVVTGIDQEFHQINVQQAKEDVNLGPGTHAWRLPAKLFKKTASKPKITDEDIRIMEECAARSYKELAYWAVLLNHWEWPKELPDPECAEQYHGFRSLMIRSRRTLLREWIENRVGRRLVSRVHNLGTMTDDEHEDFWMARSGNEDTQERWSAKCAKIGISCTALEGKFDSVLFNIYADWLESRGESKSADLIRKNFPLEIVKAIRPDEEKGES